MNIPAIIEFGNKKKIMKDKETNFKEKLVLFLDLIIGNFNDKNLINLIKPTDASIEIGIIEKYQVLLNQYKNE